MRIWRGVCALRVSQMAPHQSNRGAESLRPTATLIRPSLRFAMLLAFSLVLPFGDDLYHDKPILSIPWTHWIYLLIGLCFAGGGHMWPSIKAHVPGFVRRTLPVAAQDVRSWIFILTCLFAYVVFPELCRRAVEPIATTVPAIIHDAPTAEDIAKVTAPIVAERDAAKTERDAAKQQAASLQSQLSAAIQERDSARQGTSTPTPTAPAPYQGPVNWASDSQFLVITGGGPSATINSVLLQGQARLWLQ